MKNELSHSILRAFISYSYKLFSLVSALISANIVPLSFGIFEISLARKYK